MDDLEIDFATIKQRAIKGVLTLAGRTFFLQIVSFFGFFLLTVFLNQGEIGLFFAISELVAILGYFSDIGLAAALIQKKEPPPIKDIQSTFTIQQFLVLSLVLLTFIFTPFLASFYTISQQGIFLLWALLAGFFLASLKTIPSVLLERKLRFDLLVLVEMAETGLFYGVAVLLAWLGWGITAYTVAVLLRGLAGVALVYLVSPWRVGFAFEKESLKYLLRFGIPYQANTFLAVVKDRLMNIVLWRILGASGVGILGWAQKWAQMPLRFVMDPVMKVTFPAYARMQADQRELRKAVEKTLYFTSFLVFPMLAGMTLLAKPLVALIPRYSKWELALSPLYFFIINSFIASVTTPLTNALTAVGRVGTAFKLMVMWTVLTWMIYPILALSYGYNGVALGSALVTGSSFVAILAAQKYLKFRFMAAVARPLGATIIMGVTLWLLRPSLSPSLLGFFGLIVIGGGVYLTSVGMMSGRELFADVKKILKAFSATC